MQRLCENSGNPTHGVGGLFRSCLPRRPQNPRCFPPLPRGARERNQARRLCRLDLNDPPTAVGGIPGVFTSLCVGGCQVSSVCERVMLCRRGEIHRCQMVCPLFKRPATPSLTDLLNRV